MKGRSKFWGEFQMISNKQVELSVALNAFRRKYNMSQAELAHICTLYGEPHKIKFIQTEISRYERMATAPRAAKYQVLCNVLNI